MFESDAGMLPVTCAVTSSMFVVTKMREPGPAGSSSSRVLARKPLVMRSRCGVELNCSAPNPQWWLVTTSPSGETNDALQPPSEMTAPIGSPVRSAKRCAIDLQSRLLQLRRQRRNLLRHPHPLGTKRRIVAARARIPIKSFFTRSPSVFSWGSNRTRRDASSDINQCNLLRQHIVDGHSGLTRTELAILLRYEEDSGSSMTTSAVLRFDYTKMNRIALRARRRSTSHVRRRRRRKLRDIRLNRMIRTLLSRGTRAFLNVSYDLFDVDCSFFPTASAVASTGFAQQVTFDLRRWRETVQLRRRTKSIECRTVST